MEVMKEFRFEASHILPKHKGKCSVLHGHSWVLRVYVQGPVNRETGFVVDFADIKADVQPLVDYLDHHHLGTWKVDNHPTDLIDWMPDKNKGYPIDIYPTSENLLWWIGEHLALQGTPWSILELNETCTSMARLGRSEFNWRKPHGL